MEIWLIRNGEKSGPFHDYDIRGRIAHEELEKDDYAWHEGLPGWKTLGEIEIFRDDFKDPEKPPAPPPLPDKYLERAASSPDDNEEKKPGKKHLARRFWARWMDLMVYTAVWWLVMYAVGRDIGAAIRNPWLQLSVYIPWFAIEAWLIHRFGTTPGKWLMGLRVRNDDGSSLALKPSVWRSIRVMVTGVGFGWGLLAVLCQAMSWFTTKRIGKPIWDYLGGHHLEAVPLSPFRIMALVFFFVASAQLQMAVRGPHEEEIIVKAYPQMKEFFENGEKWYFPVKKP